MQLRSSDLPGMSFRLMKLTKRISRSESENVSVYTADCEDISRGYYNRSIVCTGTKEERAEHTLELKFARFSLHDVMRHGVTTSP